MRLKQWISCLICVSMVLPISNSAVLANDKSKKKIIYKVKRNDTLYGISRKYKVSVAKIIRWNNISRKSRIYIGQKLQLYIKGGHNSKVHSHIFTQIKKNGSIELKSGFSRFHGPYRPYYRFYCRGSCAIKAPIPGKVVRLGRMRKFGRYIVLRHAGGGETIYAGLKAYRSKKGHRVSAGDVLGVSEDQTVRFLAVRKGVLVSPKSFLRAYGKSFF